MAPPPPVRYGLDHRDCLPSEPAQLRYSCAEKMSATVLPLIAPFIKLYRAGYGLESGPSGADSPPSESMSENACLPVGGV